MTLSFVYHVDLPETWNNLKKALGQLAPKNTVLSQLLGKALLHNISTGIQNAGALPDEKKAEELRTFLTTTTDLNLGESAEEIMRDAKRGVLFREEAALSETDCGTFWTELLSTRPVEDYYNRVDPDGLFDLLSELSSAYAYFGGKKDEEMGEAQDYQNTLEEAYNAHWQNKVLLHPDVERAKRLLAQGKFPDYEDICREILLVEYPEEVPHETAEDFDELSWERVLDNVFADDPEKGMEMWRRLLDIAEPSLKTDAETAEKLLPDWDWLDSPTDDQALPLFVALDDERFVSQLFESAYLDRLQFNVLEICRDCGEETLARHCMDLALKNPCLEEQWRKRYTQVLAAAPSSKRTKPPARALARPPVSTPAKPAGESYYQFCNVQFKEDGAAYAYAGGQDELSNITLQYDTSWQQDVDALETRVKGYKAEKDAVEEAERQRIAAENAAKREQSLKDQYSGKLPVEGMPVSCLKYTSLGEPDKRLNCKNFEKLEQNQKYFNVYWYDGNGKMIAAGMCAQWRDDSEFMLKTFSQ